MIHALNINESSRNTALDAAVHSTREKKINSAQNAEKQGRNKLRNIGQEQTERLVKMIGIYTENFINSTLDSVQNSELSEGD